MASMGINHRYSAGDRGTSQIVPRHAEWITIAFRCFSNVGVGRRMGSLPAHPGREPEGASLWLRTALRLPRLMRWEVPHARA